MTVILMLSNGKVGAVVADSLKLVNGKESEEIANKIIPIYGKDFDGVLGWSGEAQVIEEMQAYVGFGSPDQRLDLEVTDYGLRFKDQLNIYLDSIVNGRFSRSLTEEQRKIASRDVYNTDMGSAFGFMAYDKDKKHDRIRIGECVFLGDPNEICAFDFKQTNATWHYELGAGAGKGKAHIFSNMQGYRPEQMSEEGMLILLAGGYLAATRDVRVGGNPYFVLIRKDVKDGVQALTQEQSCLLAKLVGYWDRRLIRDRDDQWLFSNVKLIKDGNPDYAELNRVFRPLDESVAFCPNFSQLELLTRRLRSSPYQR